MGENDVHVLIYYNGEIVNMVEGETFHSNYQAWLVVRPPITLLQLESQILEEYEGNNIKVSKVFYKMSVDIVPHGIRYKRWRIRKYEHIDHLFNYFNSFAEARTIEFFVKLQGDHFSSGGSVPDPSPSISNASPLVEMSHHDMYNSHDEVDSPSFEYFVRDIENPLSLNSQEMRQGSLVRDFDFVVTQQDTENDEEEDIDDDEDEQLRNVQNLDEHLISQSQFQSQSQGRHHPSHYSIIDLAAMHYNLWEVRKLTGPHKCVFPESMNQHAQMDYNIICAYIYSMIQADPTTPIKALQVSVESELRFKTTYRKVWLAKQKAIAMKYGDWKESYNELSRWLGGLQSYMSGTIVQVQSEPYHIGDFVDYGCFMFHRLFWTYPPCIEAFKYCKKLISIDGTHLYGKYSGTLLMAIAEDGNSNILPIAFAVVEGETKEAWSFFLRNVCQHVTPQEGILVISDRHHAIKAALEATDSGWHPPSAYHAYCSRHIVSNFAVKFKNKDAKRLLLNATYAKTEHYFLYWFRALSEVDPAMCAWANNIPHAKWAQYADEGHRFRHMTTNLSECMNAVMKGTHNLLITAIVKSTYYRLIELFIKEGTKAKTQLTSGKKIS
ncbi:uncharacterized protein LOC113866543 [Abrus precatorius]|uniref:Uncharacterized protein LOC113866543 n=1 Tax=Abrus precatorius TaxID=3816 RepID=A0A8B8LL99_ABRPR|nr:uncharacterized protein LOC113866543 [Abrus precatorius]